MEAFVFYFPLKKPLGKCTILSRYTGQIHLQTPSKNKILMILFFFNCLGESRSAFFQSSQLGPPSSLSAFASGSFHPPERTRSPTLHCFKELLCLNYSSSAMKRKDERLECGYFELSYLNERWRRKREQEVGSSPGWERTMPVTKGSCFF